VTPATAGRARETAALSAWASALRWDALPEAVRSAAALHFLDALGVGMAAAATRFGSGLLSTLPPHDSGPAPVIGHDRCVDGLRAAVVNGTLVHGLEYDDTHIPSVIHGSAVALPAVLSQVHREDVTVADLLTGFVVAWEAMVRLGLLAPGAYQSRGFQTAAVCGPPAAALAVGRVRGVPAEVLEEAFAIATSFSSGLMAYAEDGATVKRAHAGWAAHGGVAAIELAAGGLTGPGRPLTAGRGFLAVLAGAEEVTGIDTTLGDVGKRWHLPEAAYKLYPCCHFIHAYLDAVAALRRRHPPHAHGTLESVVHPSVVPLVADRPEQRRAPRTLEQAQYSLYYTVAQMFVHGHCDLADLARPDDPAVLDLAARVTAVEDPSMDYPGLFPAVVRAFGRDGALLEELSLEGPRGATLDQGDLLAEIREKFRANTEPSLGPERAAALFAQLHDADSHAGKAAATWWRP
jgi:2-methylcitrate dehydratase PrpD